MEDKGRRGLLERFQEAAGCAFLSDLTAVSRMQGTCILMEMVRLGSGKYSLGRFLYLFVQFLFFSSIPYFLSSLHNGNLFSISRCWNLQASEAVFYKPYPSPL